MWIKKKSEVMTEMELIETHWNTFAQTPHIG